jgi:hypothetical protein
MVGSDSPEMAVNTPCNERSQMTEASVMLLYSLMNNVPVVITGLNSEGNECPENFYGPKDPVTVHSISKVSNAGRHEIVVTFDHDDNECYLDPFKVKVEIVR